jgi:60Kd inner membrane protein
VVSATTTFMTVRQSAKRGLMQTNVDPDNPMAQSQKYMMYIVPFFSLTGLYWQYGLVLYWVTTNLWTLGQQFFMFRNWTTEPAGAAGALAGATTGGPVRATQSSLRPRSGSAGSGATKTASGSSATKTASGSGTAKAASAAGAAKAASSGARTGSAAGGAKTGTASGRATSAGSGGSGSARPKGGGTAPNSGRTSNGSGGARTGTTSRQATAAPAASTGQNGTQKRWPLGLGRSKQEPEPQDDVPAITVERKQPVRQARSKRSGKR